MSAYPVLNVVSTFTGTQGGETLGPVLKEVIHMAKFYGSVQGQRGEAHRLGHSSIEVVAASWNGAVQVTMREEDGEIRVRIEKVRWQDAGANTLCFEGPLASLNQGPTKSGYVAGAMGVSAECAHCGGHHDHTPPCNPDGSRPLAGT